MMQDCWAACPCISCLLEVFKRHPTPSRTCPKIRSHESNEYPTRGFTRRTKKVYGWSYAGLVHPMNGLHRHIGVVQLAATFL